MYNRRSPRRSARRSELELLRILAAGPRHISAGPIGRILKKQWCIIDVEKSNIRPVYKITSSGLDEITNTSCSTVSVRAELMSVCPDEAVF